MKFSDSFWDFIAPVYRGLRQNPISGYFLTKEIQGIEILLKNLISDDIKTVCDLGVGRGNSLDFFKGTFPLKIAIDKSPSMIRFTKINYTDIQFILGDVLNLPVKKSSFDLILCIGLMEYLSEIEPLVGQIKQSLKNKGFIVITSSPKNILTSLRKLSGHKIHARETNEVEKYFNKNDFDIIELNITRTQHQFLVQKR